MKAPSSGIVRIYESAVEAGGTEQNLSLAVGRAIVSRTFSSLVVGASGRLMAPRQIRSETPSEGPAAVLTLSVPCKPENLRHAPRAYGYEDLAGTGWARPDRVAQCVEGELAKILTGQDYAAQIASFNLKDLRSALVDYLHRQPEPPVTITEVAARVAGASSAAFESISSAGQFNPGLAVSVLGRREQ